MCLFFGLAALLVICGAPDRNMANDVAAIRRIETLVATQNKTIIASFNSKNKENDHFVDVEA